MEVNEEPQVDPFAGLEEEEELWIAAPAQEPTLNDLVSQFHDMTAEEYISFDNDLDTCLTFDETGEWREELRRLACEAPLAKRVETEVMMMRMLMPMKMTIMRSNCLHVAQ